MSRRARVTWNGPKIRAAQRAAAAKGLALAAEHILGAARRIVPHQEGHLERSGDTSVDNTNLRAAVYFDTVYAVRQHEELTWRHDPGRRAKYLEEPLRSEAGTARQLIATQIRRALS